MLEDLGLDDVWTHINSGNAAFRSATRSDHARAADRGSASRSSSASLSRRSCATAAQVTEISEQQPFGALPDGHTHLVALVRTAPTAAEAKTIKALSGPQDELVVIGSEVHWHIAGKTMDTALKPKDWKTAGAALNTTRNITMLRKLAAKLDV